jgi:hypothetical protein
MGEVVPFEDPANYRRAMQRIKKLLADGSYFIQPHAREEAAKDGFDDTDVLNVIKTGFIRPNSHSRGRNGGWVYAIDGQSVDKGRAACVVEVVGTLLVVTVYALRGRR